jgi:hypothetical protein
MIPSINAFAAQKHLEVTRAADDPQDLHSLWARAVENKYLLEARDSEDSQGFQARIFEPAMPSHFRLCGEKRKRLVGCA